MQVASNRLADVVAWYRHELQKLYSTVEANTLVDWVLEDKLGFSRLQVMAKPDHRLSESELLLVHFAFKRIAAQEPVQYVLGKGWFYGRRFAVSRSVLIPRRETEELVEWALQQGYSNQRVLDIGTGSGCIAITLKLENPALLVTAIDVSSAALEVCQQNALHHRAEIGIVLHDILDQSSGTHFEKFDLIVSNPPYICEKEKMLMKPNVLNHEPHQALFVPDGDPLLFYRAIGSFSLKALNEGGVLLFEINEAYGLATTDLLHQQGFTNIELRRDMQGKERMIKAVRPQKTR